MREGRFLFPQMSLEFDRPVVMPFAKSPVRPSGRIHAGEQVTVDGYKGSWRVISFTRDGAHLVSLKALNRTELRGIPYSRLARA